MTDKTMGRDEAVAAISLVAWEKQDYPWMPVSPDEVHAWAGRLTGAVTRLEVPETFEEAAVPLMRWLANNVHPHHSITVTATSAELLEGVQAVRKAND